MTSIFDLFKIGIGPSSSHTTGPMRAALRFVEELAAEGHLSITTRIRVDLYGSLALTGKGHGTDRAIMLGLTGERPDQVDPGTVESKLTKIRNQGYLRLFETQPVSFDCERDLIFRRDDLLSGHSNGVRFTAYKSQEEQLVSKIYYSIGGGFILAEGEERSERNTIANTVPYPFHSAAGLLLLCKKHQQPIWALILENEKVERSEDDIRGHLFHIWQTMKHCAFRGLQTEGILPGGLEVRRRAPQLYRGLCNRNASDPLVIMDWINLFAIAVSEENAAEDAW